MQVSGLSGVVSVAGAFFGYDPANTYKNATFYNLAVRGDGSLWEWGVGKSRGMMDTQWMRSRWTQPRSADSPA